MYGNDLRTKMSCQLYNPSESSNSIQALNFGQIEYETAQGP